MPAYSLEYSFTEDNEYHTKTNEIGTIIGNKAYYINLLLNLIVIQGICQQYRR